MRQQGFNFQNLITGIEKNTNDFSQLNVMTENIPLFASDRFRSDYVIGRDGAYTTVDGKANKVASTVIRFISKDTHEKMAAMRTMAQWLNGSGILVFNFDSTLRYEAKLLNEIPIAKAHEIYEFTLLFDLQPYGSLNVDDLGIPVDAEIPVSSEVPVGGYEYSFAITGADTIEIENDGTAISYPIIKLDGVADDITITYGGKSLTYTGLNGTIFIDCFSYEVYDDVDASQIANLTGDFYKNYFSVGTNSISVLGTNMNLDLTFLYSLNYL